jgi:branched-chain amino acid transport system permease protein
MLILMAVVASCGVHRAQVRLCEQVARVMEDESASMTVLQALPHPHLDDAIILDYRVTESSGEATSHWISCRFADGSPAPRPRALVGVTMSREGTLSPVRIALLQIWLRLADRGPHPAGERPSTLGPPAGHPVYLAQQLVNAIPLSSVYALIAVGFSLIYGIIGRINLAIGEFAAVAGYTTFLGISLLVVISADKVMAAIASVLLLAASISGVYGWVTQCVIFRPMRLSATGSGIGRQAALIATLGLAIFLREAMRLAGGSRDQWLEPVFTLSHRLVHSGGFAVTISSGQLIILAFAGTVVGALGLLMTGSRFGRRYRACCDDIGMAALAGIDVDRIVGRAFLLGAASAGVAGALITLHYGTVSAYMGTLIGFKALSAAVIGGLGSIAGAVLGGVTVAAFETLWVAYFSGDYRDLAVFSLLTVFLVLRPSGLLGR